jgi:regulator of sigma E protease
MSDLLVFVGILALLILGHEFGHFVAARLRGVKVNEFGIGFPPRLMTLFHAWGTRFTINALPLGGFVRPAGEDDPSVPGGLAGASKRTRALVLLAGPTANILLGLLAFTVAFKFAAPDPSRVIVTEVAAGSPAESSGLQPGDLVIEFNEVQISGFDALRQATGANLDTLVTLAVLRQGERLELPITPRSEHPPDEGPLASPSATRHSKPPGSRRPATGWTRSRCRSKT